MLHIDDLVVRYGSAVALDGLSLEVGAGEMVALVGPNGAGKSTLINTVSGLLAARVGLGAVRGPGRAGARGSADVRRHDASRTTCCWAAGRSATATSARSSTCCPTWPGCGKRKAGRLSGGQQQMVAVGRALMARPDLLAIDELSLGLAPLVVAELAEHLRRAQPRARHRRPPGRAGGHPRLRGLPAGLRARGRPGDRVRAVGRARPERGGPQGLLRRPGRER